MNIKQEGEQLIASIDGLYMVYKIIDESTLEYKELSIDEIYKKSKNKSEISSEDRGGGSEDGLYVLVKNGIKDQNDLLTIGNGTMVFYGKNHQHEIKMAYKKDNSLLEATIGNNYILFQVIDKNKIIEFDLDKKKEDLLIYERVK
jgi:hypothetical protein